MSLPRIIVCERDEIGECEGNLAHDSQVKSPGLVKRGLAFASSSIKNGPGEAHDNGNLLATKIQLGLWFTIGRSYLVLMNSHALHEPAQGFPHGNGPSPHQPFFVICGSKWSARLLIARITTVYSILMIDACQQPSMAQDNFFSVNLR